MSSPHTSDHNFFVITSSPEFSNPISHHRSDSTTTFLSLNLQDASYSDIYDCLSDLPPIDFVTYCSGIALGRSFVDTDDSSLISLFNVNFFSIFRVIRALSLLRKFSHGASIVTISSVSAYKGGYDDAYNCSKAALNGLVRSLVSKLSPSVRINSVSPGIISDSKMTRNRRENDLDKALSYIPMRKFVSSHDVASAIIYLHSDAASSITGANIDLNGGLYLNS